MPPCNCTMGHMGGMSMSMGMQMYFEWTESTTILFKSWKTTDQAQYVGSWFAVFFATLVFECAKVAWDRYDSRCCSPTAAIASPMKAAVVDFLASCMDTLFVAIHYLLMLVSMTYNAGLFFAILAGTMLGNAAVRMYLRRSQDRNKRSDPERTGLLKSEDASCYKSNCH